MGLKPGSNVNIITRIDYSREILETRNTLVHDVLGDKIIIAQTNPPIAKTLLQRDIFMSYLVHENEETMRYGLPAKIIDFIDDYSLTSEQTARAVVLHKLADKEEYNLRMFYRLEPPGNCGLDILIRDGKVSIIDISIGGASFSYQRPHALRANDALRITLVIGEMAYEVDCKVLRVWEPDDSKLKRTIGFASIQFLDMIGSMKNHLARKIRDVERELRNKGING